MNREHAYLSLAIVGAVAPWLGFGRFIAENGLRGDFIGALLANGASTGFTIDLVVSSVVLWIFLFSPAVRARVGNPWIYVVVNLAIGLSCALPLALWRMERTEPRAAR